MKKVLPIIMFAAVLILPGISLAATTPTLTVQVAALTQQVNQLKLQVASLQTQLNSQQLQIRAIIAPMTASSTNPAAGSSATVRTVAPAAATAVPATADVASARARGGNVSWTVSAIPDNGKDLIGNTGRVVNTVNVGYLQDIDTVAVSAFEGVKTMNNGVATYSKGAPVPPSASAKPDCGGRISGSSAIQCSLSYQFPYKQGSFLVIEATINGTTETKFVGDPQAI